VPFCFFYFEGIGFLEMSVRFVFYNLERTLYQGEEEIFYKEHRIFPSSESGFYGPNFIRSPGLLITRCLSGSRQTLEP
jgi:hypothetical protein